MLRQTTAGTPPGNFLEGMACEGGCVGGPGSLNHSSKAKLFVNQYSRAAVFRTIAQANSDTPAVEADIPHSEPSKPQ
jgi:iron only hydrogenase large subunit-like protein